MPWYSAGTIQVAANGTTATGTGTQFIGNVRVGDGITIAGSTALHEVTGVTSNTQLTFQPPYAGSAGSGKAYRVAPVLGYDKDLSDAFNQIRLNWGDQLSSLQPWATSATPAAARTALGAAPLDSPALTGNPTAPTVAAEDRDTSIATTAFVRAAMALFGLNNPSTQQAWHTGNLVKQASATDTTAGALMAVGAGGLLGNALSWPKTTINDYTVPTGYYRAGSSVTDTPYPGSWGISIEKAPDGAYVYQRVWNLNDRRKFLRIVRNGVPGIWREPFDTGNILGTVSQSGGIPTGAVFQFTGTASGQTWRNAAGLQICTNSNNPITTDPAAFVGTPTSLDGDKMKIGRWF